MKKTEDKTYFKIALPIIKTSLRSVKKDDGTVIEERYIEGVASTTDQDLQGDIVTPEGIKSMQESLNYHLVKMNDDHDRGWSKEISEEVELSVSKQNELIVSAKLGGMSVANDLWYALTTANKKLGLSIGGRVLDYDIVVKDDKQVRLLNKIDLDHIAVTSSPANPMTWVSAIAKSVDATTLTESETISETTIIEDKKEDVNLNSNIDIMNKTDVTLEQVEQEAVEATPVTETVVETVEQPVVEQTEAIETSEEVPAVVEAEVVVSETTEETPVEVTPVTEPAETPEVVETPTEEPVADTEKSEKAKKNIYTASYLVEWAAELEWTISYKRDENKPVDHLVAVQDALKAAAIIEINEPAETDNSNSTDGGDMMVEDSVKPEALDTEKSVIEAIKGELKQEIEALKSQLEEVKNQPAERKMSVVAKSYDNEVEGDVNKSVTTEELRKAMKAELDEVAKTEGTNPNAFAQKQAIRRRYNENYGII